MNGIDRLFKAFQSTPSAWRETHLYLPDLHILIIFQSTPSAWRETLSPNIYIYDFTISIHSLRMEGDLFSFFAVIIDGISIHSLRMEGDFYFY